MRKNATLKVDETTLADWKSKITPAVKKEMASLKILQQPAVNDALRGLATQKTIDKINEFLKSKEVQA